MPDRLRQFAKQLRADPTDAECVLWPRLKHDIELIGSHFRRQAPIGSFIVDFASRKARLVIELDGGQHDEHRAADERRTRFIEARGYRVLRFWNDDVLGNRRCASDHPERGDPHPQPFPARGKGALIAAFQLPETKAIDQ